MTEFDSFATQLLEESKALLEKAKGAESFSRDAFLHSSLLLAVSALEAYVNSIIDEILIDPYQKQYTVHEQALLLERDVRFEDGTFVMGSGLKVTRLTDRIEFLVCKYSGEKLNGNSQWYSDLKQCVDLRNKLVHPKEYISVQVDRIEFAVQSVVAAINELYKAVYMKMLPTSERGIDPRISLT